jgi:pimeloyl-ACP methyl ester carboxylesterase
MTVNLNSLEPDFAIPMFVFEGPDDYITSPELAKANLGTLNAPQNEFVMLPAGGHFAVFTHPLPPGYRTDARRHRFVIGASRDSRHARGGCPT